VSLQGVLFEPLAGLAESLKFADQLGSGLSNRCFAVGPPRINDQRLNQRGRRDPRTFRLLFDSCGDRLGKPYRLGSLAVLAHRDWTSALQGALITFENQGLPTIR
jgi:hypothetical protein